MGQQSVDQAAYRRGYSTEDHLLAATLLIEKTSEWNVDLWLGLVDVEKAFNTVDHGMLWKTLAEQGGEAGYIFLMQKLYSSQLATVSASCESCEFPIERGVKQGDPISALLFICVMEAIFRNLERRWHALNAKRKGA